MNRVCFAVLVILVTIALAPCAQAQSEAGQQELGVFATLFEAADDPILVANARYSLFVSDALAVGGGLSMGGKFDDLDDNLRAEVFGSYHFSPAEVNTLYVRGGYFALVGDPAEGALEVAGGYKSYLSERAAAFAELAYGAAIGDADEGGARAVAGLSFLF